MAKKAVPKKSVAKKALVKKHAPDVAAPGKTAPPLTSKSIIVTNRPIIKDPMVVPDVPNTPTATASSPVPPVGRSLAPLSPGATTATATAPLVPGAPVPHAPKISEMIARANKPKTAPETPSETPLQPSVADTAASEAVKSTPAPKLTPQTKVHKPDVVPPTPLSVRTLTTTESEPAESAAVDREALLQKLIDSKQYYLPINTVEKRRTKRFIALGVFASLLLFVAWGDIALDAHLIQVNGVKPLTHFFSS